MDRYTNAMRHEHFEFLQCSFQHKLCFALHCLEMTQEKDLKHPGE